MIYLFLVPPMFLVLWEFHYLWGLRKHDGVLFPICQTRRDLMAAIANGVDREAMSRDDYIYARWMLDTLNNTVALYLDHKTRLFNYRAYARFIREYRASAEELLSLPRSDNEELKKIEDRINVASSHGFMVYTPLLRSEMTVRFALFLMSVLVKLGWKAVATKIEALTTLVAIINKQADAMSQTGQYRTA